MKSKLTVITLFCVLEQACVEPYNLKNISYDDLFVIEGVISDTEKPQQIKLSHTSRLNEQVFIPESGADVVVEADSGEKFKFNEVKPGIYESSFAGVVGKGYTLSIKTSKGREYKSNEVIMKAVPPIGKIYAEFVTTPERGIKISLDTEDPLNNTHYYRWNYVETYEIQVPFPSDYVVLPGATMADWRYDRVDQCWASDTLQNVMIKSTRSQDQDKVVGFPLRFIPEDSYIFSVKYSMLVQQYTMNEETYKYWDQIKLFSEAQGSLSDVQPGTVNSNVISLTDPAETVLGYFDASGLSEQRVFFYHQDFKSAGYKRPVFRDYCNEIPLIYVKEYNIVQYMLEHRDEELAIWEVIGASPTADFELLPKACCDCSDMGTTVKPSFWK